jgi:hypothetical protein
MGGVITTQTLFKAVFELLAREDYPSTNLIFQFETDSFTLSYGDLTTLTEAIRARYPEKATREKTAVVASSGLGRALAQVWADMIRTFPHEVRIFPSFPDAEAWILLPRAST